MTKRQNRPRGRQANASSLKEAAAYLLAQGKYAAAEDHLVQVARSLRSAASASHRDRAVVWNELGIVCKYRGKFRASERYYHQALCSVRHLAGRDPLVADLYHNLGGLEHSRGRYAQAERYARRGLRLRLLSTADCSLPVAADLSALAPILNRRGKYQEAGELCRRALRVFRRQYGAVHREIAVVLHNLGAMCQASGQLKRAAYYYRRALWMKRVELGDNHPDLVPTMNNLAAVLYAMGSVSQAQAWFEKALRVANDSLGKSHPVTRDVRRNCRLSS